jgi:DNA-binding response OmpR family regulator
MDNSTYINLLLIDDDEDDRDFFRMAVEEIDYPVRCELAPSARHGMDLLRQKKFVPDFIFLDLNMPGMDGRACLKQLKENADTEAIPVVIFTTSSWLKDLEEVKELGALQLMTKPVGIDQLANNIKAFLQSNLTNQNKQDEK